MIRTVRICIYPKDIQCITGRSESFGRKLIRQIKKHFDKKPHQFITAQEFSDYSGIDMNSIHEYLQNAS
ncbi:hypothetical protein [Flavicella marina]|uniref:hypothetical protein n=1 Tax=Flavicella marina TaxID=1475951 RepID=UPI0029394C0E|nr:hypothetical protein [Flavicella marina]